MIRKIVALIFLAISISAHASETLLEIGSEAPDYLGKDANGGKVYVSELEGKVIVVSFWASWCSPCLKELPILDNIQNHLGLDKVRVIAVNFREDRKTYRKIKKVFKDTQLTLSHDPKGRIGKKYKVEGIPHLVIIDQQGRIAMQSVGYGESVIGEIADTLNELLAHSNSLH
ncbi:TlpA family protein disulfide reductase [Shewanella gelidii]|uniref:Thiol:disulfide interchange protein n=1 Tax=Shewanella gelidii TaxID=1642821 RepID=A0A917JY39_9GAMM|nr:TlpA disulfide reductase family protein [Shewanella gelidii]MCL1098909.1 TlpA family protein disulfide reductase [Shewanella gelidii]GGI89848.1 thiol:disulfide interchange protein [Shewanella gelidii]